MRAACFLLLTLIAIAARAQTQQADRALADPGLTSVAAQSASQVTLSSTQDSTDARAEIVARGDIAQRHWRRYGAVKPAREEA